MANSNCYFQIHSLMLCIHQQMWLLVLWFTVELCPETYQYSNLLHNASQSISISQEVSWILLHDVTEQRN